MVSHETWTRQPTGDPPYSPLLCAGQPKLDFTRVRVARKGESRGRTLAAATKATLYEPEWPQ